MLCRSLGQANRNQPLAVAAVLSRRVSHETHEPVKLSQRKLADFFEVAQI
jgi:hypothetical protein